MRTRSRAVKLCDSHYAINYEFQLKTQQASEFQNA